MSNAWGPFYWGDYIADTGHLTLAQHGAYLLLMAHYYRTGRPLPANASLLHRVCRCTTDADRRATEEVLLEFFTRDGEVYRHGRIDRELAKAADISEVRRAAANARHGKRRDANAPANAMQMHTQPQLQSQLQVQSKAQKAKARACANAHSPAPTLDEVAAYCRERGNQVDPQKWLDHYTANGWKVGRNPMKDWKATVRNWERNGVNHGNGKKPSGGAYHNPNRTYDDREPDLVVR